MYIDLFELNEMSGECMNESEIYLRLPECSALKKIFRIYNYITQK